MAFSTGAVIDGNPLRAGEVYGTSYIALSATVFENGLKIGRFCKLDTDSIDNLDTSATPVVAGVVIRNPANPVEDGATYTTTYNSHVEYLRSGLIAVDVKSGETPAKFGAVYASNTTGEATATNTDLATNAEFIESIGTNLWLIRLK